MHTSESAADRWDERYRSRGDRMWSGNPNESLVTEVGGLDPGTAVDIGCGEGADAIWLAERGWDVTGLDVSPVAIERARRFAVERGCEITWIASDLLDSRLDGFDLVTAHFPALPRSPEGQAVRLLIDAVSPGGTLLFVGHDVADHELARSHGHEPDDYVQPDDVRSALGEEWVIETDERRERVRPSGPDGIFVRDVVLRARRTT